MVLNWAPGAHICGFKPEHLVPNLAPDAIEILFLLVKQIKQNINKCCLLTSLSQLVFLCIDLLENA